MKTRLIFLLPLLWLLIGCSDSDTDTATLEISQSTFNNIDSQGSTLKVSITCNSTWKVSSDQTWCIPNKQNGDNNGELSFTIHANTTPKERKATITIISKKISKTIKIVQLGSTATGELHYKLPVIFHVLYNDRTNRKQYVEKERLVQILNACNLIYKNKIYQKANKNISQDMNLEFIMATETPEGVPLDIPGVNYKKWATSSMSCEEFMDGKNEEKAKEYAMMLWNPKLYINIFVYPFSEKNILGISHLPYYISSYPLDGLNKGDYYIHNEVEYPHCISLNSTYIYVNSTDNYYYMTDVYVTLAHELGHYLGLHHVFFENENDENEDLCRDTDFCNDTPSYNITSYTNWINNINRDDYTFDQLCTRRNCEGENFISHNLMDYAFCYSDQFTLEQRKRIRHVLSFSPLIPGAKQYSVTDTRTYTSNEKPPIQFKY